jgi:hypothetical protein
MVLLMRMTRLRMKIGVTQTEILILIMFMIMTREFSIITLPLTFPLTTYYSWFDCFNIGGSLQNPFLSLTPPHPIPTLPLCFSDNMKKPSSTVQYDLYCTVLYWTGLYCTVLDCTVLYCTVLYCTVQ